MSIGSFFLPERAYRWNFATMGFDLALFSLGLSFTSTSVVMPLFVRHLTSSNVALGAIPAVAAACGSIPPLFVARYTQRLHRKKPFILGWTTLERAPYLALAILTPLLYATNPGLLLLAFFALTAVGYLAGGITLGAWLDLIARMLPDNWRGRFFGIFLALGGLVSIAGGGAATTLLGHFGWPNGFALCFAVTFSCYVVSFLSLLGGREPLPPQAEVVSPTVTPTLSVRLMVLLRADRNFARYLVANGLLTTAGVAAAFYIVAATRWFALSDAQASLYGVVLLVSTTIGNIVWGYVGDHAGHKRVVEAGAVATGAAALLAVLASEPHWGPLGFALVFVLTGVGTSALQLAALTIASDFASDGERPTYIGVASTARAPFAVIPPLIGGLLADGLGYSTVFLVSVAAAAVGGALVWRGVVEPRHQAQTG